MDCSGKQQGPTGGDARQAGRRCTTCHTCISQHPDALCPGCINDSQAGAHRHWCICSLRCGTTLLKGAACRHGRAGEKSNFRAAARPTIVSAGQL